MNHLSTSLNVVTLQQPASVPTTSFQAGALPCDRQTWQRAAFSVNTGVNTLVNSGAVLFSTLARLWHATIPADVTHFNESLIQEVIAFENKALLHGYKDADIVLARFCICVAIDEAITHGAWDPETKKNVTPLLLHFHKKEEDNTQVFAIIAQLSAAPQKNIPLLTFIYLCLALGYEGKYRYMADGKEQLIQQRHHLYQLITQSSLPTDLLEISGSKTTPTTPIPSQSTAWSLPRWLAVFAIGFVGLYGLCLWGEYIDNQSLLESSHQLPWPSSLHYNPS